MPDLNKIDVTPDELIAAWGEYYLDHGQNMDNLHLLPYEESDTQTGGTIIETDQQVLREANVEFDEVLQQYQHAFTNKGGMTMVPVNIFLQHLKIDLGVIPNEMKKSWAKFLLTDGIDPLEYPLIQFIAENLIKKGKEDFELKAVYKGEYEAPVEDTAGVPEKTVDGIEKLTNVAIANGDLENPFELGNLDSLSAAQFVTKIEDSFVKEIPEKFRYNYQLELSMNRTYRDKFRQGMRDKYNVNYLQTEQLLRVMDFENVTVVGRASMIGKKRIWTTPKANLLFPVIGFSNKNVFDLQKVDRKVKFLTDWWQGVGVIQWKTFWSSTAEVPEGES
jgi:acyl carrier protein